jgi:hypothetical protein
VIAKSDSMSAENGDGKTRSTSRINDIRRYLVDIADKGGWVSLVQDMKESYTGCGFHLTADLASKWHRPY